MNKELEAMILKEVQTDDSTSHEEKMILFDEIKKLKPLNLIETGTHRGLTTLYLLAAIAENGVGFLNTADPFEWGAGGNFRKFPELEKLVKYHKLPGKDMINEVGMGIDFAFIDGFHEKHIVLEEINSLLPMLADKAVVYFHDTSGRNDSCDVPGAIEEAGLSVKYLKTKNGMAKYIHSKGVQKK